MSENGKPVFEEAAAERELDELRRAIDETRARRRRANEAFEEFLKGFGEPAGVAQDGLAAFAPAAAAIPVPAGHVAEAAGRVAPRGFRTGKAIDGKLAEVNPRGLEARAAVAVRRAVPLIQIAAVVVIAVFLWSRGGSREGAAPAEAAVVPSGLAAPAPGSATPPPATSAPLTPPPAAEVATSRRVWMRVTVDGQRVVEREVPEGMRIPLNGSQIVIRAGDAGAVRVSIAGKDQGAFGPAGQAATRTFTVKP